LKKIIKRLFVLVFASMLFVTPATALAAVDPDWVYVDPDGGFKSFGFDNSPYYIQRGGSGAIENNENNKYWRVEKGGQISFTVNFVKPVYCKFTIVRIGYPNNTLIYTDEDSASSYTCGWSDLPAGNYAMYVVPEYEDALINFYAVDTR
jgi:hypothetical protein